MHPIADARGSFRGALLALVTVVTIPLAAGAQSPTPTVTPTPTTTLGGECVGDCDDNGRVSVDEVLAMVSIAQGRMGLDACPAGHASGSSTVRVSELVAAVDHALHGCKEPSPTPTTRPADSGMCYESSDCFPCDVYPCSPFSATRDFCCQLAQMPGGGVFSWCEADQFHPSSLECEACEHPCVPVPTE
jgi:hypothetical protein